MTTILRCALLSYAKHLEAAHGQPLTAIVNCLLAEEDNDKQRVANRLGITRIILEDLFGLCETRTLEEINHDVSG